MNKHEELENALSLFHYKLDIKRELYGRKSVRNVILKISEAEIVYKVLNQSEATEKAYEELKRDVKRYFRLDNSKDGFFLNSESNEYEELHNKLSKVGEKE